MKSAGRRRGWELREKREKRGENAFIFDAEFTRCYGVVPRQQWEGVIAVCSGNVAKAAAYCGMTEVTEGAKALWGISKEDALVGYQEYLDAKEQGVPPPPRAPRKPPERTGGLRSSSGFKKRY
jgi:hypothetical protein